MSLPNSDGYINGRNYREIELSAVTRLKDLDELASRLGLEQTAGKIRAVLKDIEQHSFRIVVVGEFRRGKSTFINALLGKAILPSDVLPTTATINRVTYGVEAGVRLRYRADGAEPPKVEEIQLSELNQYVTQLTPEAEQRAASIEEAVITYPTPYCRNNVDILDTPGLNDNAVMTRVTQSALPQAHAAILVMQAISPLSMSELEFIDYLFEQGISRVMFVLSGIDRIDEQDRPQVLRHVAQRIQQRLREVAGRKFPYDPAAHDRILEESGGLRLFGVSGLQALEAKTTANEELRRASGFDEMEAALNKLVTEESGALALQAWIKQIQALGKEVGGAIIAREKQCRARRQKLGEAHATGAALAETLREMLAQEAHFIESSFQSSLGRLSNLIGDLDREMVAETEKAINEHPILDEHYAAEGNDAFHQGLTAVLQQRLNEAANKVAAANEQILNQDLEKMRVKLSVMAVTFDYALAHIRRATSGDRDPKQTEDRSLYDRIAGCAPVSARALSMRMTIGPDWRAVLSNERLPVGKFNWASRKLRSMNFRLNFTAHTNAEIKRRLAGAGSLNGVTEVLRGVFGQFGEKIEWARQTAEETLLELHGLRERAAIQLEYELKELEKMRQQVAELADRQ